MERLLSWVERSIEWLLGWPYRYFSTAMRLLAFLLAPLPMISFGPGILRANMESNIRSLRSLRDYASVRYRPNLRGAVVYYGFLLAAPMFASIVFKGVDAADRNDRLEEPGDIPHRRAFIIGVLAVVVGIVLHITGVSDEMVIVRVWISAYGLGIIGNIAR